MSKNLRSHTKILLAIIISVFTLFINGNIRAEGTKQLTPSSLDKGYLLLGSSWSRFASYGCDTSYRLNIQICNVGEKVYFGMQSSYADDHFFRVKQPDGTDVPGFSHQQIPSTGTGYISTHAEAVAGPEGIVGVGTEGYTAFSFTATTTGNYYIEFNSEDQLTYDAGTRRLFLFDLTVTDASDNAIDGRLWSREWALSCDGYQNPFKGEMYMYSDDDIVTSIKFNEIKPYYFTITANEFGTESTGDADADRKSKSGNVNFPQYSIYLNDPDPSCNPTGTYGNLQGDITITGCDPDGRCINIPVDKAGTVDVILDLNGIDGFQSGTTDRIISTTVDSGANCVLWDSRDGEGEILATDTTIDVEIHYYNGITHMPLYDVENHENGYIVELHRPNTGNTPSMFWDDTDIPSGQQNLTGCTSATGCHPWEFACAEPNSGSSDFDCRGYGNVKTINTWWYANILEAQTAYSVSSIFVDANTELSDDGSGASENDTTICSSHPTFNMAGSVTGSTTSGEWSSLTGGSFDDNTDLLTNYTFDPAEYASGATIVLTSTNNGSCPSVSDTMVISFLDPPTIQAGADDTLCDNNPATSLSATATNYASVEWVTGDGSFTSSNTILNPDYTATQAEIDADSVDLIIRATPINTVCDLLEDTIRVYFESLLDVRAGEDTILCSNNSSYTLQGTLTGATQGTWSGGNGAFSDINDGNATYEPTETEIANGSISLTYTATAGLGNCLAESDNVTLFFSGAPTLEAGSNQIICKNNLNVSLNATASTTTGYTLLWTTSGDGTFSQTDALSTNYTPGTSDTTTESVYLKISMSGSNCANVEDSILVTIQDSPQAIIDGVSIFACSNNPSKELVGTVTLATGMQWVGEGTFQNNDTDDTIIYTPSEAEVTAGVATVILNTTGNGNCIAAGDTISYILSAAPVINVNDFTVCANNPTTELLGEVISSFSSSSLLDYQWSGNGTFEDATNDTTNYTLSASEISAGEATIIFSVTDNTTIECLPVTDTAVITVTNSPTVAAGADIEVCKNNSDVSLNGSFSNTTGITWLSNGNGNFSDENNVSTTYQASSDDTATGSVEIIIISDSISTCSVERDTLVITYTDSPTVSTGDDQILCVNNGEVSLSGTMSDTTLGYSWSTTGDGSFSPGTGKLTTSYIPGTTDQTNGNVSLILSTNSGYCNTVDDTVEVVYTPGPTVTVDSDQAVCADSPEVTVTGNATNSTGILWSGGTGIYSDVNNDVLTYMPHNDEIDAGTVTLTLTSLDSTGYCQSESEDIVITISDIPTVSAGSDISACGDLSSVSLNGSVSVATGGTWSTSGTGTFSNSSDLTTNYLPSKGDTIAGSVQLTLTTTGNGNCLSYTDNITITFTDVPVVDAGTDTTFCTNDIPFQLNGSGSPATWSTSGTGTFDNPSNPSASYTPSADDTLAGTIQLTLTTDPNGSCASIFETITVTIPSAPVVNAGDDISVCEDQTFVSLSGSEVNTSATTWSTDGTGSFNSTSSLTPIYSFSAGDVTDGSVNIFLTSSNVNDCQDEVDTLVLTLSPTPTSFAGLNQEFCADIDSIAMNGIIGNAGGGVWSTTGSGSFSPNDSTLTAYYIPSANDTLGGGPITMTLTTSGNGLCNAVTSSIDISFTPAPSIEAGNPVTICADSSFIEVNGSVSIATGGLWSTSGTGTFDNTASLTSNYTPSNADTAVGDVMLYLTSTGNGTCKEIIDSLALTISPAPYIELDSSIIVCGDTGVVNLNAAIAHAGGSAWSTSGDGSFGDASLPVTTYTLGTNDSLSGSVTLFLESENTPLCQEVQTSMIVTITDVPTVATGFNQTICGNTNEVDITGTFTTATGISWVTTGDGTFGDNTSTSTTYQPGSTDTANGGVQLVLTTTGNGDCKPVTDTMDITINQVPTVQVNAGADSIEICADSAMVELAGTTTGDVAIVWRTTGTGNFFPDSVSLNVNYVPSAADTANGEVSLVLSTKGAAPCEEVSDTLVVTITPAPEVEAGNNQTVCADTVGVSLSGSTIVSSTAVWTTNGTGTFSPGATLLNTTYIPSALDTAAGSVTLTLTSTSNGLCKATSDNVVVTIEPAPQITNVGDQTICADNSSLALNSTMVNAGGVIWSTSGSGSFSPSATTVSPVYSFSSADSINGNVELVMTTTDNGLCQTVSDTLNIILQPIPTTEVGNDLEICGDGSEVSLNATFNNSGGALWSTSGSGTFSPSATATDATYTPSTDDVTAGDVVLKFTTVDNGVCATFEDSLTLTVTPEATVSVGDDILACEDADYVLLSATKTNFSSALWTSSGTGSFDVDTFATASYTPSQDDINDGSVTLTYTVSGNGSCGDVSELMILTFEEAPSAEAGSDLEICELDTTIQLVGTVVNSSKGHWETSGTGTFTTTQDSAITNYKFSTADKTAGTVVFELTAFGISTCGFDFDSLNITFAASPTINAGDRIQTVCGDTSGIQLESTGSNGFWSGGDGIFTPDTTASNPIYKPTNAELSAGTLDLYVTSLSNGSCPGVTDTVTLDFEAAPTLDLGGDVTVCSDTSGIDLNPIFTNATGGIWSSNGTGAFDDVLDPTTTYIPSTNDINDSIVILRFKTVGHSAVCDTLEETIKLFITPAPTTKAGSDQSICANQDSLLLSGNVDVASGGSWTTSGTGDFSPNDTDLSAYYIPSTDDRLEDSLTIVLTSTGNGDCKAVLDTMMIRLSPVPTIDAGGNDTICANETSYNLTANVQESTGGTWQTNGSGTFSPTFAQLSTNYMVTEEDTTTGQIQFVVTSTGNGICAAVTDTMNLVFQTVPIVSAGTDIISCKNTKGVQLEGTVSNAATAGWETFGSGTFNDTADLDAIYVPSSADFDAGAVIIQISSTDNGVCVPQTDLIVVDFNTSPVAEVNAGLDQNVCADAEEIDLEGQITIAEGGIWHTTGTGTFLDTVDLTTIYYPSSADSLNGAVSIILETTGNGFCEPEFDTTEITITPAPTISAGQDLIACGDTSFITLSGTYTVASASTWTSSGTGEFSENEFDTVAVYVPSDEDVEKGLSVLTLTTTEQGTCLPVTDQIVITYTEIPTIDAGTDREICADQDSLGLLGTVTTATGGEWSTFGSGSFTDDQDLNSHYTPSDADKVAGIVVLEITSTGNGSCKAVTSKVNIQINQAPTVEAGSIQTVCANNADIQLNGEVTIASGGTWSGGLGSYSTDANTLDAVYTPTQTEIDSGEVNLILTSTGNDLCNAVMDSIVITISTAPTVSANSNALCADLEGTSLDGSVTIATGGIWSTSGTGVFALNAADLSADYIPSVEDKENGTVILTLTTDGNGNCLAESDDYTLFVKDLPVASAGDDQIVCENESATLKVDSIQENVTYAWSTTTATDLGSGAVVTISNVGALTTVVVTATDLTGCETTDTMNVDVTTPPTFSLNDQICFTDTITLESSPSPAAGSLPGSFQWYNANGPISGETGENYSPTIADEYVIAYNYGLCYVFDTSDVTEPQFNNSPYATLCLTADKQEDREVTISVGDGGTYSTITWFEDDKVNVIGTTASIVATDTGYYFVNVEDSLSCENQDSILVYNLCPPKILAPTAFIPGGEGGSGNVTFDINAIDVEEFNIRIFNRWGEVIFESDDINYSWDGNYKGEPMPIGTYPWIITYTGVDDDNKGPFRVNGAVTIYR